jgi:phage gp37-like protein
MAVIATIEDTMVAALTTAFAGKVPVETVPAGITAEEWGQRLRAGTAVYIAWLGAETGDAMGTARLNGEFAVYVVSESAGKEVIRRRGNDVRQGAYLMIEIAVPAIHLLKVPGIGTLELVRIDNLYAEPFDKLGIAVYACLFRVQLAFDAPAALQDFLTFGMQIAAIVPGAGDQPPQLQPGQSLPLPDTEVSSTSQVALPPTN